MSAQAIQLLLGVLGITGAVVAQLFGYRALEPKLEALRIALQGKIDVQTYQAKVTELHGIINEQGKQLAVQAEQIKRLDERGR